MEYKSPVRDAQREATKAKITQHAKVAFDTLGWEGATIRAIAKAAGVSTGCIFGIWPDGKKSLWSEITQTAPPTDGALWRSAPGMLATLEAYVDDYTLRAIRQSPKPAASERAVFEAAEACIKAAKTRLPFEPF